jgi:hypothetical protein
LVIVDTDLLRMGADFSQSAGAIVQRGADTFASSSLRAGAFGDFDAAHGFHRALSRAHEAHVSAMHDQHSAFEALAVDANAAASIFVHQDEASGSALDAAAGDLR